MREHLVKTIQEGLEDEFNGALNYTYMAAKSGDFKTRKAMLQYAQDEINHSLKLIEIMEELGEPIGDVSPNLTSNDNIFEFIEKYRSKEQSAIYYYDLLLEILDDKKFIEIVKGIKEEEQEHFQQLGKLLTNDK